MNSKVNSSPVLLDLDQLENFVDLGLADFLDILGDVLGDVPTHIEMIHSAIRDGDAATLRARAHSSRGMLANFGCVAMTGFLHRLEHEGPVAPELAGSVRDELENLWQQSYSAIKDWEKSVPGFIS